jgi:predicted DNA-binding transcriptional regulator AlpA
MTPTDPMTRQAALPPTLAPRLIGREAAAAYVCVSPTTFDRMILDGRMPRPRRLYGRRIAWDVRELDAAVDVLPVEADDQATDDTWSDIDAAQETTIR